MQVVGRGYRDGVRSLEVMLESLSGGRKPKMELKNFLFNCS